MKKLTKSVLIKVKNHVSAHKFGYAMGTITALAVIGNQRNIRGFTEFLNEKGIDPDEYFNPEYYEEKNA